MIYKIFGNPKQREWGILPAVYVLDSNIILRKVYKLGTGRYCIYLNEIDLRLGDDIIIELLRQGKALIHSAIIEETSQQYWLDELGKVKL